jgi:hypothetical protein
VAALLHADGRFAFIGMQDDYFEFSGDDGLTPVVSAWVDLHGFFYKEFAKNKRARS